MLHVCFIGATLCTPHSKCDQPGHKLLAENCLCEGITLTYLWFLMTHRYSTSNHTCNTNVPVLLFASGKTKSSLEMCQQFWGITKLSQDKKSKYKRMLNCVLPLLHYAGFYHKCAPLNRKWCCNKKDYPNPSHLNTGDLPKLPREKFTVVHFCGIFIAYSDGCVTIWIYPGGTFLCLCNAFFLFPTLYSRPAAKSWTHLNMFVAVGLICKWNVVSTYTAIVP